MKFVMFSMIANTSDWVKVTGEFGEKLNDWLDENSDIDIKHIIQSGGTAGYQFKEGEFISEDDKGLKHVNSNHKILDRTSVVITVWYEEESLFIKNKRRCSGCAQVFPVHEVRYVKTDTYLCSKCDNPYNLLTKHEPGNHYYTGKDGS